MARPTKAGALPEEIRQWLEQELVSRKFTGYRELTAELNRKLEEAGEAGTLSREAVRRHAEKFGEKLEFEREIVALAREQLGEGGGGRPSLEHMQAVLDALHVLTFRSMLELRTREAVPARELERLLRTAERTLKFEIAIRSAESSRRMSDSLAVAREALNEMSEKLEARAALEREAERLRAQIAAGEAAERAAAAAQARSVEAAGPARPGTLRHETPAAAPVSAPFGTEKHGSTWNLTRQQRRYLEREQAKAAEKAAREARRTEEKRAA